MTEDEARKKWCPMARVSIHAPEESRKDFISTGNRWQAESSRKSLNVYPQGAQCIASDCMMWRWEVEIDELKLDGNNITITADDVVFRETGHGYCGLAK